ncbi:hypothetical protein [Brevibacillus laterosporus]|uniref:Uncharacterized protein n=1 Tax=Brevibacillus laterosporus TaxID=1465 RepID=A0AAP8QDG2_BRELA|nr:hypothetical protein [Brevibacillus laterosporus]MED1664358.1 hypothetical protein [Brevibacillus laterosporus]MED1668060.1 hypothetical protein [Brevibacillus laterosporus]MED1719960.1 hypothetical protein [Brevibacillus laterosporus]PPA89786.1 hypothetical protein C4A76_01540 [Brevibacillus laterosporus]PPB03089.1 hypothetical protein C4A77_09990 [Brevibacillus laterosporus]
MASGEWLKLRNWFPDDYIPLAIVVMGVTYNAINDLLYGGDILEATRLLLLGQRLLSGIHLGIKN